MNGQDGGDTVHEGQAGEHFAALPQSGSKEDREVCHRNRDGFDITKPLYYLIRIELSLDLEQDDFAHMSVEM